MLLSLAQTSHAVQLLDAVDGVAVEAIMSIKEPTRIRIDGAAITDVVGSIHSSHCAPPTQVSALGSPGAPGTPAPIAVASQAPSNPQGEVVLECDRDKGEIYIRPMSNGDKPINLFISSSTSTFTLVLRRADTPADTIVIRDRTPRAARPLSTANATDRAIGPAPSHVRAMKALLVAMVSDRVPPDIRVEETSRALQLWTQAKLALVRLYEGRGLIGELYDLQNVSSEPIVLAEQEFDRQDSGDGSEVIGIAIDRHNLRPGESTRVYVIRRGGAR